MSLRVEPVSLCLVGGRSEINVALPAINQSIYFPSSLPIDA